jgi:drug/metabolite transporter (DMT)-like permease
MVSLGYVWTLVWSKIFFGEPINRTKLAGVGLVLVGVVFIAVGNQ